MKERGEAEEMERREGGKEGRNPSDSTFCRHWISRCYILPTYSLTKTTLRWLKASDHSDRCAFNVSSGAGSIGHGRPTCPSLLQMAGQGAP